MKESGGKKKKQSTSITENFYHINASYIQYKFYLEWKNENDSIKYFPKHLGYKQGKQNRTGNELN